MAFVYCYYNNDHELLWQQDQVPSSYVKIRHIHDKVFYHRPVEFVRPKIRELQSSEGWKERERERERGNEERRIICTIWKMNVSCASQPILIIDFKGN